MKSFSIPYVIEQTGRGEKGSILSPAMAQKMLAKQKPGGWGLGIEVDGAGDKGNHRRNAPQRRSRPALSWSAGR